MRRFVVGLGMMVALASPCFAADVAPVAEARYLRQVWQGEKAYEQGDFAGAEQAFRAALGTRPGSAAARLNLGDALFRAGKFPEAQAEFQKAMESDDKMMKSRAAYNMGNALVRQDKLEAAAEAYKKALRWNEQDEDARYNLDVVLKKLEDKQKKDEQKQPDKNEKDQKKEDQQKKDQSRKDQSKKDQSKKDQSKKESGQEKDQQKQQARQPEPAPSAQPQSAQPTPAPSGQPQSAQPAPAPSGSPAPSAAVPEKGDPSISKADAERILRYFQEKERSQVPRRAPRGRVWTSVPGEQTW